MQEENVETEAFKRYFIILVLWHSLVSAVPVTFLGYIKLIPLLNNVLEA